MVGFEVRTRSAEHNANGHVLRAGFSERFDVYLGCADSGIPTRVIDSNFARTVPTCRHGDAAARRADGVCLLARGDDSA